MIPAGLGNIVGGGLFVGTVYWYLHLAGNEVEMPFDSAGPVVTNHNISESSQLTPAATLVDANGISKASGGGMERELHGSQYGHSHKRSDDTAV